MGCVQEMLTYIEKYALITKLYIILKVTILVDKIIYKYKLD